MTVVSVAARRQAAQLFGDLQAQTQFEFLYLVGALFALVREFAAQQFVLRGQSANQIVGVALGQLQISDFGSNALNFFARVS